MNTYLIRNLIKMSMMNIFSNETRIYFIYGRGLEEWGAAHLVANSKNIVTTASDSCE